MIGLAVDLGFLGAFDTLEGGEGIDAAAFAHRVDLAGADRVVVPLSDGDAPGFDTVEAARIAAILRIPFTVSIRSLDLLDAALKLGPDEVLFLGSGGGPVSLDLEDAATGTLSEATARVRAAEATAVVHVVPSQEAVLAAQDAGAGIVEIDTVVYGRATTDGRAMAAHRNIVDAARTAGEIGIRVRVGGGAPDATRLARLAELHEVESVRVGAALLRHVVYEGVSTAVGDVRRALERGEFHEGTVPVGGAGEGSSKEDS
ncbi:MAG: pyridoxine 5'-phosphate synthase [Planctomycetota bacterium]